MRLIDADALKVTISNHIENVYGLGYINALINEAPTLDVAPVVRGKWVYSNPLTDTLVCSECDWNIPGKEFVTNFCPNCGAKMEVVNESACCL